MFKTLLILLFPLLFACEKTITSSVVSESAIVGTWSPTYLQSTKNANGVWSSFQRINTLVPLPEFEFKADGSFYSAGKAGAACCFAGNKYSLTNSKIVFSEKATCSTTSTCQECSSWDLAFLPKDSLIIEQCTVRSKFIKLK